MSDPVAFPDIEAALVAWLPTVLAAHGIDQPVTTRVPNPRPARFIRVVRTGGPQRNVVVDGAQVTFECWDDDAPAAAHTARIVRAVVAAARNVRTPSGELIYHTDEFSGPALLPDVSGQPRYSWTVQLHTRGVPLPV
ncbi:MAG: hypothetical protein KY469_10775 [Actinobacteria bacterium]|nr:hypothetical protein [Actinomycetota bacterium]